MSKYFFKTRIRCRQFIEQRIMANKELNVTKPGKCNKKVVLVCKNGERDRYNWAKEKTKTKMMGDYEAVYSEEK